MRGQPLIVVFAAATVGILFDRNMAESAALVPWICFSLACGSVWLVAFHFGRSGLIGQVAILAMVAGTFALWHNAYRHLFRANHIARFAETGARPICLEALALESPIRLPAPPYNPMRIIPTGDRSRLAIEARSICDGQEWTPTSGLMTLIIDGHLLGVRSGDRLRVHGMISRTAQPQNPGQFDFANYARTQRELCFLRTDNPACVKRVHQSETKSASRWLDMLRTTAAATFESNLDHRPAALAKALVLGIRHEMDQDQRSSFREVGAAHFLAISGLHVGVLAGCIFLLGRLVLLSERKSLLIVVACIGGYAILSGGAPATLRATVLIFTVCLGRYLGRQGLGLNSLALAGLVVLAWNPASLFQVGAQLSFLAAGVLVIFSELRNRTARFDPLDRLIEQSRPFPVRWIRWSTTWAVELTIASAAIWLVSLPLTLARFHLFAPVGVLLNPLLWLPTAVAVVAGFATSIFSWISTSLAGWTAATFMKTSLSMILSIVSGTHQAIGAQHWTPGPPNWWLAGFYALLIGSLLFRSKRRCFGLVLFFAPCWIAAGFLVAAWNRLPDGQLRATFLSVGHGLCICLELPGGETVLYDAGSVTAPEYTSQTISQFLWSRGIRRLDALIVSHADADHFNAIPDVLDRVAVGTVLLTSQLANSESPSVRHLITSLAAKGIPTCEISALHKLKASKKVTMTLLHPLPGFLAEEDNAASAVLFVEYAGQSILLTGDLEGAGLQQVLAEMPRECDVLLAPHHGSPSSQSDVLLNWCQPEIVVVSGDDRNDVEHTLSRFAGPRRRAYHTQRDGAVTVVCDAHGIKAFTWAARASMESQIAE